MVNENYIYPNKQFQSSDIYEDIDIPIENRDYDVLQDETIVKLSHKDIQIKNEINISNKPLQKANKNEYVDAAATLTKQNPKNNFKNLFNRMTNTRKKLSIFIFVIVLIVLFLIVILLIIILVASIIL